MSKNADKRGARHRATARADQLRPLNLPQPVTVELDEAGSPSAIVGAVRLSGLCQTRPRGPGLAPVRPDNEGAQREPADGYQARAVESIIEAWHIDDEWWREPISRRYMEVILEGGKHVVLYEDFTTGDWFMQMP